MAKETILVVEDDENILELITYHLEKTGYRVLQSFTGEEAIEQASVKCPDLILLDLMLPNMSGLEVCEKLKGDSATRSIPIVIVSARGADTDVVIGLEAGADDYIIKPFHPPTFVVHVQEILRRATVVRPKMGQDLNCGDFQIAGATKVVSLTGTRIPTTDMEFQVLHYLLRHAGQVCTRGQIQIAIGGEGHETTALSVDDQVESLRQKLGDKGTCIEAVRRIGFRIKDSGS